MCFRRDVCKAVVAEKLPCLWGKPQERVLLHVSENVLRSFCVAGVALCDIQCVSPFLWGSHKDMSFSTCQMMCSCRFAWQAWHFDFTLHTPHSTLYTRHSTLHTLHSHFTLHTPHLTLYTLHFTLHTLHSTPSTLHTLHFTLYTSHSTLSTLHSTLYTQHFTLHTPHVTLHTLHSTLHTLH